VVWVAALRIMRNVVFGLGVYDASTLFAEVLVATILPGLKIAKIDPARSLRDESAVRNG